MNKQKALEKIKKCLALSKSANEHEAAQALKQAQALMRLHQIDDLELALADVCEHSTKAAQSLPKWQWMLANLCFRAFGCRCYLSPGYARESKLFFVGIGGRPELAAYAYEVLLRQLKKSRREFIAVELKRVRLAKNKTYRADMYCEGWVSAVRKQVQELAQSVAEKALLKQYMDVRHGDLATGGMRSASADQRTKAQAGKDWQAGAAAGKDAQLHHAMGVQEHKQLEVRP